MQLNSTEDQTLIDLPEIYDANQDSYTVTLLGSKDYFSYDQATNQLKLDKQKARSEILEETLLEITVQIKDSKGYQSS